MVHMPQPGAADLATRDSDRAAVLVRYTLLGAAINGFFPEAAVVTFDCGGRGFFSALAPQARGSQ